MIYLLLIAAHVRVSVCVRLMYSFIHSPQHCKFRFKMRFLTVTEIVSVIFVSITMGCC